MIPPGVKIHGNVILGENVSICEPAELNGTGSSITIGDGCDIAAFTVLNVADSSDRCIGRSTEIKRAPIVLGGRVFVGSHCLIGGGATIRDRCKVAAHTAMTEPVEIPCDSLVTDREPRWHIGSLSRWHRFGRLWVKVGCYA